MKHKHLKHLFTALLLVCCIGMAKAEEVTINGIKYDVVTETKKATVIRSGNYSGNIVIPSEITYNDVICSVTSIGERAFYDCTGLTSIIIPGSVTSIGDYAFSYCSGLTSITIPNSVTSIGYDAFNGTAWYNNQPDGVVYAGKVLYKYKGKMPSNTSITVKEGTLGIADNAFHNCDGLTSVVIGNSVTNIGYRAFSYCDGLTSVVIGNSVTSIGEDAFYNCSGLTSIVIGNSVTSIGKNAFSGCSGLTSIEIPNSVTSIGSYAFDNCSGLKEVRISDLTAFCNIDFGVAHDLFFYAEKMYLNGELVTELVIPEGVTEIKNYAFNYCPSLTSITIPNSVISIGSEAFYGCYDLINVVIGNSVTSIGKDAFRSCSSLKEVYINNLSTWCNIDFGSNEANPLYHVGSLYLNDELLTELVIPEDVKKVKSNAFFYCYGLTNVVIGNNVTCISQGAFNYCYGLNNVVIGNSVTDIEHGAFLKCDNLTSISVESGNTIYDSRENCNAIIETETNTLIAGCKNTIIPNSVTSIGEDAFWECTGLTSIEIPNSVTSIGESAFRGCYLASVEIPNSVTSIGMYAFSDCIGLKSAVIGNSVTSIGLGAFFYCTSLASITSLIPAEDLFTPGYSAFYNVNKTNCTLYVPYGAKETYAATEGWNEFTNIVELEKPITEVTVTIGQYGNATYCSPYALDFSEVDGLKAYNAIGYKPSTQTVTLARVMTTGVGQGVFIKGEPGEYTVPVIDNFDEYTLNLLVGTLEATTVNSTEGEMSNYKFTVAELDEAPMFYPFEDNTPFSAGKAYLQIPTAWLPVTAQKSLNIRFDDSETTDIDELKGESGEVKTIYDLQGRVVENPTSGIYIINGKKVVVK